MLVRDSRRQRRETPEKIDQRGIGRMPSSPHLAVETETQIPGPVASQVSRENEEADSGRLARFQGPIAQHPDLGMERAATRGGYLGDQALEQRAKPRLGRGLRLNATGLAEDRQPAGGSLEPFEQGERTLQQFVPVFRSEQGQRHRNGKSRLDVEREGRRDAGVEDGSGRRAKTAAVERAHIRVQRKISRHSSDPERGCLLPASGNSVDPPRSGLPTCPGPYD